MKCPKCTNPKTGVLSTHESRRRRECPNCGHRFNTLEIVTSKRITSTNYWYQKGRKDSLDLIRDFLEETEE